MSPFSTMEGCFENINESNIILTKQDVFIYFGIYMYIHIHVCI